MKFDQNKVASRFRLGLIAITAVIYVAIAWQPPARSYEWTMLRGMVYGIERGGDNTYAVQASASVIRNRPHDTAMQIAVILRDNGENGKTISASVPSLLRGIEARAGVSAALLAAILRSQTDIWSSLDPPSEHVVRLAPSSSDLAAYMADAAAGEKLDPTNAYFPAMHAVGDAYEGDTDGVLRDIASASRLTKWDAYTRDEILGSWRLDAYSGADMGAVTHLADYAAVRVGNFAAMRKVSRLAEAHAAQLENEGRVADGVTVRHAVMRLGALIRTQDTMLLGDLVGAAIEVEAMRSPGGALPPSRQSSTEAKRIATTQAYTSYLYAHGQPTEARWCAAESTNVGALRRLGRATVAAEPMDVAPVLKAVKNWLATAENLQIVILLWTAVAFSALVKIFRPNIAPLTSPARWGAACGTLCLALAISGLWSLVHPIYSLTCGGWLAVVAALWSLASVRVRHVLAEKRWLAAALGGSIVVAIGCGLGISGKIWPAIFPAIALIVTIVIVAVKAKPRRRAWGRFLLAAVSTLVAGIAVVIFAKQMACGTQFYAAVAGGSDHYLAVVLVQLGLVSLEGIVGVAAISLAVSVIRRGPFFATFLSALRTWGVVFACALTFVQVWDIRQTARYEEALQKKQTAVAINALAYRESIAGYAAPGIEPEPQTGSVGR